MKLVKFVPAIAATLVLAACSTAENMVSSTTNAVSNAASATTNAVSNAASATTNAVSNVATATKDAVAGTMKSASNALSSKPTFETAAYFCDVQGKKNQVVSATYAFVNGKIDTATITINRKVVGQEMKLDPSYKDGTQFVEGKKVWALESGFTQATASKTMPIMFTDNNQILAKNCEIAK